MVWIVFGAFAVVIGRVRRGAALQWGWSRVPWFWVVFR